MDLVLIVPILHRIRQSDYRVLLVAPARPWFPLLLSVVDGLLTRSVFPDGRNDLAAFVRLPVFTGFGPLE